MNDFIFSLSLRLEAFNLLKVISFTSIFQGFSLGFNLHLYGSPELMYIYKYKFKYMYICNIYIYLITCATKQVASITFYQKI